MDTGEGICIYMRMGTGMGFSTKYLHSLTNGNDLSPSQQLQLLGIG